VWEDGMPADATWWDVNGMNTLSAICNAIIILTFGNLYKLVADVLNDWENHRTQVRASKAHVKDSCCTRYSYPSHIFYCKAPLPRRSSTTTRISGRSSCSTS
jgi:hypothetical protein